MSRRKQSKPQHVEFGNNTTVSLSSEIQPNATGATIAISHTEKVDRDERFILTEELSDRLRTNDCSAEATKAGRAGIAPELEKSARDNDILEKTRAADFTPSAGERAHRSQNDLSFGVDEIAELHQDHSPDSETFIPGQFAASHRSLLHPRYSETIAGAPQKRQRELGVANATSQNSEKNLSQMLANSEQWGALQNMEVYACERCDATFDQVEDFVQHKNFECTNLSLASDLAADQQPLGESSMVRQGPVPVPPESKYVVSGNVIMANGEERYTAEMNEGQDNDGAVSSSGEDDEDDDDVDDDRRRYNMDGNAENGLTKAAYQAIADSSLPQNEDHVAKEKLAGDCAATVSSSSRFEASANTKESFFPSEDVDRVDDRVDDRTEEQYGSANEAESDAAEKLRKEILATEAMAQAIQNMTAFASQSSEENGEKPDVVAIKYQVRMIQQQQAYQVQMLNFLQWQLALASSNPQAAVAAAAAATSRNAAIPNGFGPMNPAVQPPFLAAAGGLPGGAFMPQMMAAMAMNNFKNASSENNGVSELAKARIMMGMQQAAAGNDQNLRNMFGAPLREQDDAPRNDQEQRYQLKVATEDVCVEFDAEEAKLDRKSENKISRTKSDSGFDEEIRSSSANGGAVADDASSSHDSQEDGELRDSVLKSTAEEHRHRCHYCHKVFGSDSGLQIHIRSHTGERPFKCNICGNRFTTKGNLKVHFTRHKSKYPHIPMNSQPVPEYLDHVPTSNGVPYGMSILPEKAVLERPRLHGNPSIHLSPQQATALSQRDAQSVAQNVPNVFFTQLNGMNGNPEANVFRGRERPELPSGMGTTDMASAIQMQLLQRRRAELIESQWAADETKKSMRSEDVSDGAELKNSMSILQAAMLPFLPGIAARQQLENVPPHLRYLLPHHLNIVQAQNAGNGRGVGVNSNINNMNITLPTLPQSTSPPVRNQRHDLSGKMADSRQSASGSSSETTKLQRLVENIDRGRVLQKNECHTCHRILSCQSALKLHYRTHTGERPYKCDLCSRAFTTRGNLRTHYSSVHRQQMRPLPPGGNRSSQAETFSCALCPSRFRDPIEFQHHMQMHAMARAQEQKRMLEMEREKRGLNAALMLSGQQATEAEEILKSEDADIKREPHDDAKTDSKDEISVIPKAEAQDERNAYEESGRPSSAGSSSNDAHLKQGCGDSLAKNERNCASPGDEEASGDSHGAFAGLTPLDSLAALSNISPGTDLPQHTGSMLDHQLAALSRARAGRLTVCEICEKPFSCQSALEIHLRTHTKERPFLCKICQRAFTTKGNLKQHLLTHNITDIPEQMLLPVSSPKNDNSASTSPSSSPSPNESQASLGVKRACSGDSTDEPNAKRTFPRHWCHICQKQFSSASSLQIHNRTHTGEKPFACNACGRAFTTKGNLKVHMGTHVWGAGGSRRGRRISMDNPLISPWMKNMTRTRPTQPLVPLPTPGHVADPAVLYQQYAALANGFLSAKQDASSRFMLPVVNGISANTAVSPVSSSGSPHPNEMAIPQNGVNTGANLSNPAVSAATEWFLKAYQRTQEQVN